MKQEIQAIDPKDFFSIVRAIGLDLEHTQVRMIASANADMLFHYWKVGHSFAPNFFLILSTRNLLSSREFVYLQ